MEKKGLKKLKDKAFYTEYMEAFLKQNSILNLISKNDEKFLWEKHIFDSLAIENFFRKYPQKAKTLLDIGTGGGFPSVPIALTYPEIEVTALDSIKKKLRAIDNIKEELGIKNLKTLCDRAENINGQYDLITSRAVAPLKVILNYAMPLLKNDGYFIAYKSLKADEEIQDSQKELKKYNAKIIDIIKYELPLAENHTRKLIVISK